MKIHSWSRWSRPVMPNVEPQKRVIHPPNKVRVAQAFDLLLQHRYRICGVHGYIDGLPINCACRVDGPAMHARQSSRCCERCGLSRAVMLRRRAGILVKPILLARYSCAHAASRACSCSRLMAASAASYSSTGPYGVFQGKGAQACTPDSGEQAYGMQR